MSTSTTFIGESGATKTNGELTKISVLSETWTAQDVLRWAFSAYHPDIAIASAFGAEGMALIDMATAICQKVRIFTLDTELLFPETYQLAQQVEQRYKVRIEWVRPDLTVEKQAAEFGPDLWKRDPDRCCQIRKVAPLVRKVQELDAWITAIRRDQTHARARASKIEWDGRFGLVKINPLADWTHEQVWQYIRRQNIPYNPLHDQNYPSIGCVHCTRSVLAEEDPRAGRWSGNGKKECGLHESTNARGTA
jgi:phosphoadenosine phosphosulfate reductase